MNAENRELITQLNSHAPGFIGMLDATMSHAAFGQQSDIINVATLEIKVSFLEPSRAATTTARLVRQKPATP